MLVFYVLNVYKKNLVWFSLLRNIWPQNLYFLKIKHSDENFVILKVFLTCTYKCILYPCMYRRTINESQKFVLCNIIYLLKIVMLYILFVKLNYIKNDILKAYKKYMFSLVNDTSYYETTSMTYDPCNSYVCYNGGTCTPTYSGYPGYYCQCSYGFSGPNCK